MTVSTEAHVGENCQIRCTSALDPEDCILADTADRKWIVYWQDVINSLKMQFFNVLFIYIYII